MPPALTDDEGSMSGEETADITTGKEDELLDVQNGEESEEEGDKNGAEEEDEEEELYIVENIIKHAFDEDGVLKYQVKWLGYDKKSDLTWEPEDNLSGAKDLLKAYHKTIGGRPTLGETPASGRKRKQSGTLTMRPASKQARTSTKTKGGKEGTPVTKKKPIRTDPGWEPPKGLWEDEIICVESIEQSCDTENGGDRKLEGYVTWSGHDKKSKHPLALLYKKCPQKMLQYYERHLVFKDNTDPPPPKEDYEEEGKDDMQVDA